MTHKLESAKRNINSLKYADGTPLLAESEEELKEPFDECERRVKKLA